MSQVFFTKDIAKVAELFDAAKLNQIITPNDFVALKIHFGERGNTAYLKPDRVKPIVKKVRQHKGQPFWTDANTLYKGTRGNTLDHLQTAFDHGYTFGKTGAHVLIADGLEGKAYQKVNVNYKHFKDIYVAPLILEADSMITITHFKGHELTGFGGVIKNIGMGLGSRAGKQQMHADVNPQVDQERCTACGRCLDWCPTNAISWADNKKAIIDRAKCIGCAECIATCRFDTIGISWTGASNVAQEKIVEYTAGILKNFKDKAAYITFITDVSENCDCWNHNSEPIIPDVGVLASFDPVAIDQAAIDLVNQTEGRLKSNDKFKEVWPNVDWSVQLKYAEEIGLGNRKYELINL